MKLITDEMREFAIEVANQVGDLSRAGFTQIGLAPSVSWKDDGTPVTKYDLAASELVIGAISSRFPTHRIVSEEHDHVSEVMNNSAR